MPIRFPRPLRPGDTIAITSPSSGVTPQYWPRLEAAIAGLRDRGYEVVIGECMDGSSPVSAAAVDRARELTDFLTDPRVRAVVPPWGGELAIDLLPLLDWDAISEAEPTWFVGFSDISTLITPLTLRTGIATLHGSNMMDTPYRPPAGLLHWLDIATLGPDSTFTQTSPGRFRAHGWDDYVGHPEVSEMTLDSSGSWTRFDDGPGAVDVSGRLIGGCIDTLCNVAGSPFGEIAEFARRFAPEGLLVYIEASGDDDAVAMCRQLHGMRLAGFFEHANAVLVGRTRAADEPHMTVRHAVRDALGGLGVPIIGDVECGHVQPFMPIVNGALGRVRHGAGESSLTQTLV
ncbi:S66 peptidase family protein [Microbacterium sp. Mu-80]|uniref:S66 peptidase family protein n=1 Tax=Microbacterium bandirmense TaxID=3122050 RepID=A0ABU8LAH7_9MICO